MRARLLDDASEGAPPSGSAGSSGAPGASGSSDTIGMVQGQLNDVKSVMQENVNVMLNNLEKVRARPWP